MKSTFYYLFVLTDLTTFSAKAQITFKAEYMGSSAYVEDMGNEEPPRQLGDGKGSVMVYRGNATIPFLIKKDKKNRTLSYGVSFGGAYVNLNNKNIPVDVVSEIMNLEVALFHLRPLNEKWSLLVTLGAGAYLPSSQFSQINHENILGSAGVIFIRHFNPNLDVGAGVSVNNTFGYPMVFPALYLNWTLDKKLKVKASVSEGVELTAGYKFNDYFSLSLVAEINGQMALLKKDGKDKIFSHQYIISGIRPEIKIPKSGISIPLTFGINAIRPAFYSDRTLKAIFSSDNDYSFKASLYASAGINYTF